MKTAMSEMKSTKDGINGESDIAEEKSGDLEEAALEIIPKETERKRNLFCFLKI